MDIASTNFVRVGSLEELKSKGRLVVRGSHRPILVVYERGRVFAFSSLNPGSSSQHHTTTSAALSISEIL